MCKAYEQEAILAPKKMKSCAHFITYVTQLCTSLLFSKTMQGLFYNMEHGIAQSGKHIIHMLGWTHVMNHWLQYFRARYFFTAICPILHTPPFYAQFLCIWWTLLTFNSFICYLLEWWSFIEAFFSIKLLKLATKLVEAYGFSAETPTCSACWS